MTHSLPTRRSSGLKEDAIQRAARSRYGAENDIRAKIDPKSGDMRLWRVLEVVDPTDDYFKQISPQDAQKKQADAATGDIILHSLPPNEFGRIAAPAAQQVILPKARYHEPHRPYAPLHARQHEITTRAGKTVEF